MTGWHQFFEKKILEKSVESEAETKHENYSYKCKLCAEKGHLNKLGMPITIKATGSTTSNLKGHVEQRHPIEDADFLLTRPTTKKRKLDQTESDAASPTPSTPNNKHIRSLFKMGALASSPKYSAKSIMQTER